MSFQFRNSAPVRFVNGLLWPRKTGVRASFERIQFQQIVRFTVLFALTVFLPCFLMAWLGLAGSLGGEEALRAEVVLEADGAISGCLKQVEEVFDDFENKALARLDRRRSAVQAPEEISPYLLLSVTLDAQGRMIEPFDTPADSPPTDQTFFYSGSFAKARAAEALGHLDEAATLYRKSVQEARGMAQRGTAELERARVLAIAGHGHEADALYQEIVHDYGKFRDASGFLIGDLARLESARLVKPREPAQSVALLRDLVDQILSRRWQVGRGGDGAVARQALKRLENSVDPRTIVSQRNQVGDLSSQLFQAERLLPELQEVNSGGTLLRVAPREFRYTRGNKALWATVWLGQSMDAFALDLDAILNNLQYLASESTQPDGQVRIMVVAPDAPDTGTTISRRALVPWLAGWALTAEPRDYQGLKASLLRQRSIRIAVILVSVLLVFVGAFLLTRFVSREMELAAMKTAFAASVSHELRSPITQIRLKGESLLLGLAEDEADRQRHYKAIVRESERLSRLVDNVLDFAAIERGTKQYNFRPADIAETVSNACETMRQYIESRGIRLEVDIPDDMPIVHHDPDAVAQVLINLLTNAFKYGGSGHWIGVSMSLLDTGVEIRVADRGMGISEGDIPKIFEKYYRSSDPRARRHKGTGIGLAIVKYIMDAHTGQILVESKPGRGAVFRLIFPFVPRASIA
jgi:signal transduction histidine kinase